MNHIIEEDKVNLYSDKISERIWGHRFMDGQRGVEYVLEFLNVIAGTDYKLNADYYQRKKMVDFRRFVFEGEKDGRANKGEEKFVSFQKEKKEKMVNELGISCNDLDDIQLFFKNLKVKILKSEGKSVDRSWYAQSLFPLNDSLLFFELRSKKENVSDFERNFFARGGELYYLMLTYGSENNKELRESIEKNLKKLMSGNKNIGIIVDTLCKSLDEESRINFDLPKNIVPLQKTQNLLNIYSLAEKSEYPTLPCKDLDIYKVMAEDINALLEVELDIYESIGLLTSLINFHIFSYMLSRSCDKFTIFIDCMDGKNPHIKRIAQHSYKDNERLVKDRFDKEVDRILEKTLPEDKAVEMIENWKLEANLFSGSNKLLQYKKFFDDLNYTNKQEKLKLELINTLVDNNNQAYQLLKQKIKEITRKDLKTQNAILNTLSKDGGFLTVSRGVPARYTLSDNLLSAFVFTLLQKSYQMPFMDFKKKLYERYNIVIAENEARDSGIYEMEQINLKNFKANGESLRSKLRKNGLLEEYSDATALIKNPYYN